MTGFGGTLTMKLLGGYRYEYRGGIVSIPSGSVRHSPDTEQGVMVILILVPAGENGCECVEEGIN